MMCRQSNQIQMIVLDIESMISGNDSVKIFSQIVFQPLGSRLWYQTGSGDPSLLDAPYSCSILCPIGSSYVSQSGTHKH